MTSNHLKRFILTVESSLCFNVRVYVMNMCMMVMRLLWFSLSTVGFLTYK